MLAFVNLIVDLLCLDLKESKDSINSAYVDHFVCKKRSNLGGVMKCLLWLLLTFGFIIHPDYHAIPLMVDGKLMTSIISDEFNDGTKAEQIEIVDDNGKAFLMRQGFDEEKNCHISRTEMIAENISGMAVFMMPIGGVTETCTGNKCSNCGFKEGGGCECKVPLGFCNHTISRNTDMIRIF